jgi:amino acid adenylation domain-containing protein
MNWFSASTQQAIVWRLCHDGMARPAQVVIAIDGIVDDDGLAHAWQGFVARHEIFRTVVQTRPGHDRLVQAPVDAGPAAWTAVACGQADQRRAVRAAIAREAKLALLLEQPPLARAALVCAPGKRWLIVTLHPWCVDYRTLANVAAGVARAYADSVDGTSDASTSTVQYLQYCEYHRQVVADEGTETLSDIRGPRLSGERVGGSGRQVARALPTAIDVKLHAALARVARDVDVAVGDLVFACWQATIRRLAEDREARLALLIDGRSHPDLDDMMGPFAKALPVSYGIEGSQTLVELARLAADERQRLAARVDSIVWEHDEPPITFAVAPRTDLVIVRGASFAIDRLHGCFDPFRLKLLYVPDRARLECHYDAGRFTAAAIRRLADRLLTMLRSVTTHASTRLDAIHVVPKRERRRLIVEWNRTRRREPWAAGVPGRIADQAKRTPDAVAVTSGRTALTYAALDRRARQLAARLRALGVGPETRVGISLPRSSELVIALLAVWKAGGAYVPIDLGDPAERRAWMVADAGVRVMVTSADARMDPTSDVPLVTIDEAAAPDACDPPDEGVAGLAPEHLAYVLYTSGSMGRPKGVMVTHAGLLNYVGWCASAYEVEQSWGAIVQSPITFDLTVTSLLAPLVTGRTIDLVAPGDEIDGLAHAIAQRPDASLVKLTPTHLAALSTRLADERACALHVRRLVVGGEPLHGDMLREWRDRAPDVVIVNEYGPTETVVGCCTFERTAGAIDAGPIPIGRPIANTQLYVLDDERRLVPVGVTGELYIGGAGVARGYTGRPALTAERFVPDPFSGVAGARLYRTGDLARHRDDGMLECLGRTDTQVKIRGHRIDVDEIEALLREHPSVAAAVVEAREDGRAGRELVAYVVGHEDPADRDGLRMYLAARVPDYMMPAAWVSLDALPVTAHGKLDRAALPAPEHGDAGASDEYDSPIEKAIADVWMDVLRIARVGRHHRFFDVGGHSLLAVQVMSRVRRLFGVDVPLAAFFDGPTVHELAIQVKRALEEGCHCDLPPLTRTRRPGPQPLSFAQQTIWIENQMTAGATYNISAAVRLTGHLDAALLQRTLTEIVRRHEILRTVFVTTPAGPRQVIRDEPIVDLEPVDLRGCPAHTRARELTRRMTDVAATVFDLARGPLLRVTLFRLGDDEHVSQLTMHHILSDQWSTGVLIDEVATVYAALREGRRPELIDLPIQYADYAVWERSLPGDALASKIAYWKRALEGAPPYLALPTDRSRPARRTYGGGSEPIALSRDVTRRLKDVAASTRSTLYSTLLAVAQVLLYRYSGQDDFVVGTPFANRSRPELSQLIGFFVNLVPIRARLSRTLTFTELAARVRTAALGAYAHQEVPFDQLLHALGLVRRADRVPLVQVVFVLLNAPVRTLRLPGLDVQQIEVPGQAAAFDLTFGLTEREGQIVGELNYDTDLFEPPTARRLADHFMKLAEAFAAQPDLGILDVPLTDRPTSAVPGAIARAAEFAFSAAPHTTN